MKPDIGILLLQYVVVLFSLSVHESAHAWTALRFGDPTGQAMGRITLNPARHIDVLGTVVLPVVAMFTGAPLIGWAKPVLVNPLNLRDPRRDHMFIAAAGPISNVLLALIFTAVFHVFVAFGGFMLEVELARIVLLFLYFGIFINLLLAVFNLIPVPPLDGGWIIEGLSSDAVAENIRKLRPFGILIIYGLLFLGIFSAIYQTTLSIYTKIFMLPNLLGQ